jgi:hypothetical protein
MTDAVSLTSRYWAEVALNTPVLWAKISVSPHDSLEKARRKLERSKSCPLDITINFSPRLEYTGSITEQVILAMDLIRPAFWRTKSFLLSVPNRPQAHAALLRCQEDAPLLETLSIQIFHSMQDDRYSAPRLPLFNGHTPRLSSCSFTSFNFGWDRRLVSRLRVLKLGGYFNAFAPSANTLLDILRQCPDLEELALRNLSSVDSEACPQVLRDFDSHPPHKNVHLRRLTKVSFYYAGIALTLQIMSQITFPNLEALEMSYLENVTPVLHLLYIQALTRLPLRHLRIETCLFNEIKFVNLLRRLPSLLTLELVDVEDVSSNVLKVRRRPFLNFFPIITVNRVCRHPNLGFVPGWSPSLWTAAQHSTGIPFAPSLNHDYLPTLMLMRNFIAHPCQSRRPLLPQLLPTLVPEPSRHIITRIRLSFKDLSVFAPST